MIATDALRLMLVMSPNAKYSEDYLKFVEQCALGGVSAVQLRNKELSSKTLIEFGKALRSVLKPLNVALIVNDDIGLAKAIKADGIHLGQKDAHPDEARARLGPEVLIGLSIESLAELALADALNSIDYVAASAVFVSATKRNCKTFWGLEGLRTFVSRSRHPVVGIGGIQKTNVAAVISTGAIGVAISEALHAGPATFKNTQEIRQLIDISLQEHERV